MNAGTQAPPPPAPAGPSRDGMVTVGRIARTHGLRGDVVVNPETDFPEVRFRPGSRLLAAVGDGTVELRVARARFQRGRPIVAFDCVPDVEGAERLAGVELGVPESALAPLPPDTFYEHELVGCRVETVDGRPVGAVRAVEAAGGATRLIVASPAAEVDVPLVDAICVRVDPAARSIVIDPPPGLIDLNPRPSRRRKRPAPREARLP